MTTLRSILIGGMFWGGLVYAFRNWQTALISFRDRLRIVAPQKAQGLGSKRLPVQTLSKLAFSRAGFEDAELSRHAGRCRFLHLLSAISISGLVVYYFFPPALYLLLRLANIS